MTKRRGAFLCACFVIGIFLTPPAGQAASFPTKPITLINPFPAGGATDVVVRPLAAAVKDTLKQPVIVENKPGGSTAVGVGSVVGKKPDGYLLTIATTTLLRTSYINKIPFDPVKDIAPLMRIGGYCFGVVVKPDSRFQTLKDVVDFAKSNPGKLSYMSGGIGTGGHIGMEELAFKQGFKVNHIPSKGDPEASMGVLGGHVEVSSCSSGFIPLVEGGQLKLLATYTEKRTKAFPNVPTVAELGYKVVEETPFGVFGPKGMPKDLVATLQAAFKKALDDPAFVAAMDKFQMPIRYQSAADFAKFWAGAYITAGEQVKNFIQP